MFRQNYTSQKPENVLTRVSELIASSTGPNADKEKQFALEQLHNVVSSSKRKQWSKVYETIMCKHMELCVDLKDNRLAKDGLHQYRNMVQNVDPNSLENVIVHLLDLAEARATAARNKANIVSLAATAKVTDLDQAESPESIMLSTMTIEGVKDRTDREVVVPWLKFLWDAYRAVLELLHKNAKLEKVYHKTCEKAFAFCQDYQRTLEFRRLCDMLRQQLTNIQKFAAQPSKLNRVGWEWTPESIEIHLQIRFTQLEVATGLEQLNEGFRTVEDIHQIMQLSKKPPKPRLMAAYYEKLTRIFWVSENHLFHAYAWFKYYTLCCEYRKDMKPEEKAMLASNAVLAALCTPDDKGNADASGLPRSVGLFDDEAILHEKNQQMAALLDFRANPSRSALLAELAASSIINDVIPELKDVVTLLEDKFHPLTLVKTMLPVVNFVKSQPQLQVYSKLLQKVSALHTVLQLSKVYSSIRITTVTKLFAELDYSYVEIEDMLCDAINKRQLSMQIDHSSSSYRFGPSVNVAPIAENQLTEVGRAFRQVAGLISPASKDDASSRRRAFLARVSEASKRQHTELQERKSVIERRKEGLERMVREREKDMFARKQEEEEDRRREESQRLEKEEKERQDEKVKAHEDIMQMKRIKMEVEALGKEVDEADLKGMDVKSRQEVLTNAQQEVRKAKEDEVRRLAEQAKVLDYITRATRMEAGKNVEPCYKKQEAIDRAAYDTKLELTFATQKTHHASLLAAKKRLGKLTAWKGAYEAIVTQKQKDAFEKKVSSERKEAWDAHRSQKVIRARYAKSEEDDRLHEEQERARELAEEAEYDRLQALQHEELQQQRDRELEELNQRRVKEEEERRAVEAAAREVVVPREERREEGGGRWGSRGGGDRDRDRADDRGEGGGWAKQGPPGRQGGARDFGFGKDRAGGEGGRDFGFGNSRGGDRNRERDGDRRGSDWNTVPSKSEESGGRWGKSGGDRGGGGRDFGFGSRSGDREGDRGSGGGYRGDRGGDRGSADRRSGGGGADEGGWRRR